MKQKLSDEETAAIYRRRKLDVDPVFGFMKANLGFTCFSVLGIAKVNQEMALMATNLRKYTLQGGKPLRKN